MFEENIHWSSLDRLLVANYRHKKKMKKKKKTCRKYYLLITACSFSFAFSRRGKNIRCVYRVEVLARNTKKKEEGEEEEEAYEAPMHTSRLLYI